MPIWSNSPSFMIAIRSPNRIASAKSCVMNTIVRCSCRWRRINSSCMSRRISGSSAENGSSKNSSSGSSANARARPTRCCIPPDSCRGWCIAQSRSHAAMREQPEVLEHHRHLRATHLAQLLRGHREQVLTVETHLTCGRLDQSRQTANERRLAAAGQSHHHERLAPGDVEAHVAHADGATGGGQHLGPRRAGARPGHRVRGVARSVPEHLPQTTHLDHRRPGRRGSSAHRRRHLVAHSFSSPTPAGTRSTTENPVDLARSTPVRTAPRHPARGRSVARHLVMDPIPAGRTLVVHHGAHSRWLGFATSRVRTDPA